MKILAHLEKNKLCWFIILFSTLFFLLRLPSVIEPYWYGDEGIYEVIGQSIASGHLLYRDIWDNKPPLLYLIYAIANGDQTTVRFFSLFAGILSLVVLLFFTHKLFRANKITGTIGTIYVLLFATPLIEGNIANAENFMLFPIILAGYWFYSFINEHYVIPAKAGIQLSKRSRIKSGMTMYVGSGLLLGIAFLFKIVALFDFTAFIFFVLFLNIEKLDWKYFKTELPKLVKSLIPFATGFIFPFCVTALFFLFQGTFTEFIQATFAGNVDYVGFQNTFYGVPQGLLLIKIILLIAALSLLFIKRKSLSPQALFIFLWLTFSLFNTFFSGRPYTHYMLVLLPSLCLLIGFVLSKTTKIKQIGLLVGIFIIFAFTLQQFKSDFVKSVLYYNNAVQFLTGAKDVSAYQAFFDIVTPRDYAVASFINTHTNSRDHVFIWGDHAQIYAMTHKLPPNKYAVAYHINQNQASLHETEEAVAKAQPKYIIVLTESQPLPFDAPLYIMRFSLEGATIYERSL
jgi:hypothetical protein